MMTRWKRLRAMICQLSLDQLVDYIYETATDEDHDRTWAKEMRFARWLLKRRIRENRKGWIQVGSQVAYSKCIAIVSVSAPMYLEQKGGTAELRRRIMKQIQEEIDD